MTPSEIETHVGAQSFQKLRSLLSKAWRSAPAPELIDAATVAAAIEAEWSARADPGPPGPTQRAPALAFLPAAPAGWSAAPPLVEQAAFRYYDALAEHARSKHEQPHSAFLGILPQVRVSLPERPPAEALIARTAIGYVFTHDHLLTSVSAVRTAMIERYGAAYADITRVDVISPARLGSRFGAVGMYLGYRNDAASPSFYLLEAGLATGPSVRLFTSPDLGPISHAPTAYLPTPFVELSNTYDATLSLNGDDPATLFVQSFREPRSAVGPRVEVTVSYQPRTAATVTKLAPGDITLMAAERIAAVADALGETAIEQQHLLAAAGRALPWIRKPV
jgi:hypothetical protein